MDYQTYLPHPDLEALIKCYWTLEVPADPIPNKQRIIPDGCIEMAFILGDEIKRYTSEDEFIIQPRAMVLGQTIEPFYIEPTGYVNTFAIRFYPYGFANFVSIPLNELANKETALNRLFGEMAAQVLEQKIIQATSTAKRIEIIENFLLAKLKSKATIDQIVQSTIDSFLATKGRSPIQLILKNDLSKRRQLERKFLRQIGISAKQLGKVIRLQAALKLMLKDQSGSLTEIAYESEYFDQAHFIRDFKAFTGTSPKAFFENSEMALSALIYKKD